jgi:hypothetical protein
VETPNSFEDEDLEPRDVDSDRFPRSSLLELGEAAFFMEGEYKLFTSEADDVPGFNTMFAAGTTRPICCLHSSTRKWYLASTW